MPGIFSNLFKPGEKELERKRKSKERKEQERQIRERAFQRGRARGIERRAYREGAQSARPLTEKITSGFDIAGGIFGISPPRRKQRKQKGVHIYVHGASKAKSHKKRKAKRRTSDYGLFF